MFKLVVLCAFLAAVVAEPGAFIAPLAYSTSVISPASTTITNQASSVIHPSPLLYSSPWTYSAPLAHLIKKRSPGLISSYVAPSYITHAPLATSYVAAPLASTYSYPAVTPLATTYTAPIYSAAHLIKKRSAPFFLPSTYIAPTYAATAPLITSTYTAAAPILSSPVVSTAPIAYTHLIKKRSAPLALATYSVPSSFSHQSRVDIHSSPAIHTSYSYSAPLVYSAPILG